MHRIVVFQKAAENCSQYLGKGSLVFIEGKLETRKWRISKGRTVSSRKSRRSASSSLTARRTGSPASSRKAGAGSKADATPLPHPIMETSAPRSRPRPPAWTDVPF